MISGRDAFSQFQSALMTVRREEDSLVAALNSAIAEAARLRAEEAQAWRALARVRLDALARETMSGQLDSSERQALDLIAQRQRRLAEASARRDALRGQLEAALDRRASAAEAVERAAAAIDEQRARTQARLREDPRWKERVAAVARAKDTAASADEKARLSEAEKDGKKKPYEADALFMYLWKRGHGTSAYKAGVLARYFDRKVADLIGYDELRPNYFMLNEIPARLRDHAVRLKSEAEAKAGELSAFERAELEADGVAALEGALAAAENSHHAAETQADALERDLKAREAEDRATPDEASDPSLKRALDIMADALSREDLRQLEREALQTPSPEDETIVRRIGALREAIANADRQVTQARQVAIDQTRKRQELERTTDRFRQRGYDDPFGGFKNGEVIGSIIGGVLSGILRGGKLDDMLEDAFSRRRPRTRGDFGGGIQLPGGNPWGRGGRMSGGWSGQPDDEGLDTILDRKRQSGGDWGDIGDWIADAMKNAGRGGPWPKDSGRGRSGDDDDDDSGAFRTGGRF